MSTKQTMFKVYISLLQTGLCNSQTKTKPLHTKTILKGFIFTSRTNTRGERHIHTPKQISCVVVHIIDRLWDEQRKGETNPQCVVKGHQEVVHCEPPAGCLGFRGVGWSGAALVLLTGLA